MIEDRFLIVGLGNPGREYAAHRHNVGFMLLDRLAEVHRLSFSRVQHQALVVGGRLGEKPVLLAKPQTFMNASGQAVGSLARFFKIPLDRLLVAYDDLDLPLGTLRFRERGGSGGHKGMRSIIEHLGSDVFARVRLGIGRPSGRMDPADYVLSAFRDEEIRPVELMLAEAADGIRTFLDHGIVLAMSRHNGVVGDQAAEASAGLGLDSNGLRGQA